MKISNSSYIHFHDSDDLFQQNWCRRVRKEIEDTSTDFIITELSVLQDNAIVQKNMMDLRHLPKDEDIIKFVIEKAVVMIATIFRRDIAIAIGGFREGLKLSGDWDFHVRLAILCTSYSIITEPLAILRRRQESFSSVNNKEAWLYALQSIRLLSEELDNKYHINLAEKAALAGSILFDLGARSDAREAFKLADKLGPPNFKGRKKIYRFLAKTFRPLTAEYLLLLRRKFKKVKNS